MAIKIIAIITESLAQAMAVIKHGGHAIETETIELILLQPELTIRQ